VPAMTIYYSIILAFIGINLAIGTIKTIRYIAYLKEVIRVENRMIAKLERLALSEMGAQVYIAIQEFHLKYYEELYEHAEYKKNKFKYVMEDILVSSVTWPITDIFRRQEKKEKPSVD
jgi:hypothetical protein